MKDNLKVIGYFAAVIAFALAGFVSCTEGGSLAVKNSYTEKADVSVWFEDEKMITKEVGPGETKTWTFSKDGSVYYGYYFADDYDRVPMTAKRVLVMGGDVTKVTIKP
jgi:hypothetical protein